MACQAQFASKFPGEFVAAEIPSIEKECLGLTFNSCCQPLKHRGTNAFRFMLKHSDIDLLSLLDDSVPPLDLMRVSSFRVAVLKFNKKAG